MKRNVLFLVVSLVAVAASARADERWVTIAAAASTAEARAAADFACTGTNDEVTIQKAIDLCKKSGKQLFLFCGLYRLGAVKDFGDGGPLAAVCIRNMHRDFEMVGERRQLTGGAKDMLVNGVVLYLEPGALAAVGGKSVDIVRGEWSRRGRSPCPTPGGERIFMIPPETVRVLDISGN